MAKDPIQNESVPVGCQCSGTGEDRTVTVTATITVVGDESLEPSVIATLLDSSGNAIDSKEMDVTDNGNGSHSAIAVFEGLIECPANSRVNGTVTYPISGTSPSCSSP